MDKLRSYFNSDLYEEVLKRGEKMQKCNSDDLELWLVMSISAIMLNDCVYAEELMLHALQLEPNSFDFLSLYGTFLLGKKQDPETALKMIDKALIIYPGDVKTILSKARCLYELDQKEGAVDVIKDALAIEQTHIGALGQLLEVLITLERYEEALRYVQHFLKIMPDNTELYFYLAVIFNKLGNNGDALYYIERASRLKPKNKRYQQLSGFLTSILFSERVNTINDAYAKVLEHNY